MKNNYLADDDYLGVPAYGVPTRNTTSPQAPIRRDDDAAAVAPSATTDDEAQRQAPTAPEGDWMTSEEASGYLAAQGVHRSMRTIQRRCKDGGFSKTYAEDAEAGKRWFIDKAALNQYVEQVRRLNKTDRDGGGRHVAPGRDDDATPGATVRDDAAEHDATATDTSQKVAGGSEKIPKENASEVAELRAKIMELEKNLINEKIEKMAAHQTRDFIQKQNENIIENLNNVQYRLGAAESQLEALAAPQEAMHRVGDNSQISPPREHVQ